jgi:pimeloyl-ACP methyl ester carboxylesterase
MGDVRDFRLDVGDGLELAGTYFPPLYDDQPGAGRAVLICLPGGTYTRGYFDLDMPGYSYARDAAERGFPVVSFDQLGTGESSRPDRDLELSDQARAVDAALRRLPDLIGRAGPFLAVGHSMGGYVAMVQQAAHRSYAGLAILGTTNGAVGPLGLPEDMVSAAATPEGRAALIEQIAGGMPDLYIEGDRSALQAWFHLADVPEDVVERDLASTLTVVPRRAAAASSVPFVTAAEAAQVDVPVFLAYGETDVSTDPRQEPAAFARSPAITLFVLPRSGHCHNMASSRQLLWDRLARWCETVVT